MSWNGSENKSAAAAPKNEYQKVIWEKCRAEANEKLTNPIKIVKEKK